MTPTPEPSPSVSVSREQAMTRLCNAASAMLGGISRHNAMHPDAKARREDIAGPVVDELHYAAHAARLALIQPQPEAPAPVALPAEVLALLAEYDAADAACGAAHPGVNYHAADERRRVAVVALTDRLRALAEAPAEQPMAAITQAELVSLYERLDHWEGIATRRIGLRRELELELFGEVMPFRDDNGEAAYRRALAEVRRLRALAGAEAPAAEGRWIPVSERLPDIHQDVALFCKADGEDAAEVRVGYMDEDNWRILEGDWRDVERVTHWHQLPTPPALAGADGGDINA